jgi:hypothetical protein
MISSLKLLTAWSIVAVVAGCSSEPTDDNSSDGTAVSNHGDVSQVESAVTSPCSETCKSKQPTWIKGMHYHGTRDCLAVQVFAGDFAIAFEATYLFGFSCGPNGRQDCRYYHYEEDDGIARFDSFDYQVNCATGKVQGPFR